MATPLSVVRAVCGRPAFTGAGIVTLHDSWRCCWNRRNTLASRWRWPQNTGRRSVHQYPTISKVTGGEFSSFVYSTIIRTELNTAVKCEVWVHFKVQFIIMTHNTVDEFFYVHVTVHRNKLLDNKANRGTNFPNLFWHGSRPCSKVVYEPYNIYQCQVYC